MHESFTSKRVYTDRVSALWARASEVGLDEEAVYDVVAQVSGARSVSSMSPAQFNAWFAWIDENYGPKKKRKRKRKPKPEHDPEKVIELATTPQKAKIREFARHELEWCEGWTEDGRDCAKTTEMIERLTRKKKSKIDQLLKGEAWSIIEALKKIHERVQQGNGVPNRTATHGHVNRQGLSEQER
jgi:hypothetical protein